MKKKLSWVSVSIATSVLTVKIAGFRVLKEDHFADRGQFSVHGS